MLTIKQRKLIKGVVEGKSGTQAAIEAGYSPKSAGVTACHTIKKYKETLTKAMERAGIDSKKLAEIGKDGIEQEDRNIRHKYYETILKIRGDYAPEKHEVKLDDYSNLREEELDERIRRIEEAENRIDKGKGKTALS